MEKVYKVHKNALKNIGFALEETPTSRNQPVILDGYLSCWDWYLIFTNS